MCAMQQMSGSEAEVMQLLWRSDTPMTSAQIISALEEKHWKPSTIWTFLGRLVDKGLIHAEKVGKRSFYTPAVTESDYRKARTVEFLDSVHGGSIKNFFAALGGAASLSADEINELKQWLDRESGGDKP